MKARVKQKGGAFQPISKAPARRQPPPPIKQIIHSDSALPARGAIQATALQPSYVIRDDIPGNQPSGYVHRKGAPIQPADSTPAREEVYQANPYPDVEALLAGMQPTSSANELAAAPQILPPKPVYSKVSCAVYPPKLASKHTEEYEDVIDRKNFRDLAYQQLLPGLPHPIEPPKDSGHNHQDSAKDSPQSNSPVRHSENKPPLLPQKKAEYKPYTLRDYQELKPQKYYVLGGLGANVGGDMWKVRKQKLDRMTEYARGAQNSNKSELLRYRKRSSAPGKTVLPEVEEALSRKLRMIQYAKQIPKPKLRPLHAVSYQVREIDEIEKTEPLTELEKLEMQHNEYLEQVERLKRQLNQQQ